jgi:c-di-GMP-binding flagellar brake protein YcgR
MLAREPATEVQSGASAALPPSDSTLVFNHAPAIARLLDEAREKRRALTLKLDLGEKLYIYHSRIQQVDAGNGCALLHKLVPSGWQDLVTEPRHVEVSCQLPSGMLRFQSKLLPQDAEEPLLCRLTLPSLLYKHQLRASFRVILPPGSGVVALPWQDRVIRGYCLNLSLEGCCGVFRGEFTELQRDTEIVDLAVSLDEGLQFRTDAAVCRKQAMPNGSTQIGLRFDPLPADLQRKLQTSLTGVQRRQLRRNA